MFLLQWLAWKRLPASCFLDHIAISICAVGEVKETQSTRGKKNHQKNSKTGRAVDAKQCLILPFPIFHRVLLKHHLSIFK